MSTTRPPQMPDEKELREILNYTFVALVGMLAGFMIGYLYGHGLSHHAEGFPTNHTNDTKPKPSEESRL